jgi:hypothetical protein
VPDCSKYGMVFFDKTIVNLLQKDLSIPLDNSKILIIFFCNLYIDR